MDIKQETEGYDIAHEMGSYRIAHIRHRTPNGNEVEREVRWFPSSHHAYRKSETMGGWVFLGTVGDMDWAARLAARDMYKPRAWR